MVFDSKRVTYEVFENKRLEGAFDPFIVKKHLRIRLWRILRRTLKDWHAFGFFDPTVIIAHGGSGSL
jgi:hypothetical protein